LKGQSAIDYLLTYGWMLIVVAIVVGAVITTVQEDDSRQMPENFSLSESRQAVQQAMPGKCTNTWNQSYDDYIYHFECSQNHGNYTYTTEARVVYNSSGKDQVYIFN